MHQLIRWASLGALALAGAASAAPPDGVQAKICSTCHKTVDSGNIRGHFEDATVKGRSLQVKVDGQSIVLAFDPAALQVTNASEAGELEKVLKSVKKGTEVRVVYALEGGVKRASALVVKPKLKVAPENLISTEELEKLVAQGPERARYFLYDARPAIRFAEGYLPTAESLPFPAFEKEKGKLPADKAALVVFYCSGVT